MYLKLSALAMLGLACTSCASNLAKIATSAEKQARAIEGIKADLEGPHLAAWLSDQLVPEDVRLFLPS